MRSLVKKYQPMMFFNLKGESMYIIKRENRKATNKALATKFNTYEAARNILRTFLRRQGLGRVHGQLGYSIQKA